MNDQLSPPPIDSPDGDFEIGPDGLVLRADRHACNLLGMTQSELFGRPLPDILAPGEEDRLAGDRQRMANGTVLRTEWLMRRADGSVFTAEVIARGLDALAMRFIARDATRVKAADLAKARLAAIVESSDDAIISKTLSGIVTTWNAAAERIFGYRADEMIGRSIRRLIPEDRAAEEDEFLTRIARGERVQNHETVRRCKDGSPVYVSVTVSPIRSDSGTIIGASKIARDVSAAYDTKRRLRESDERFGTLADNISQLAWMADSKGWIFWYNQRWYDYTGTTLEEMQGWGWRKVHHPDHVDRVVAGIQRCWDTGEPWEDTFPLCGADGEYRWFLSRALPIRDEQDRIVRWFGTNTDITEQKQREEQIRLLMREVNHRSKNMLALVQAIARQTVAADTDSFIRHFQQRIQGLSSSQNLLVRSSWRGVSMVELVESQLAHFSDLVGNRIRLHGPDLVVTSESAQAIGMALHELGTNAGKYGALSNERGYVEVRWSEQDEGEGPMFHVSWQEFDGPAVEAPQRRGFGSVVIEKMVGVALGATSELEFLPGGVRWMLHGPSTKALAERPAMVTSGRPQVSSTPPRALRVLLIDDNPKRALAVIEQLQASNHGVIGPVATIDEAFASLSDETPDCVVLGDDFDSQVVDTLLTHLAALKLPHVHMPTSGLAPGDDLARFDAPVSGVDARKLVSAIERLCVDD
ncbi:MAG: PAS domain S-box protein [Gammaproteobacteria bacterium]|nr:PAS domain S-box protein [Gammaproteobacteria bacterium]